MSEGILTAYVIPIEGPLKTQEIVDLPEADHTYVRSSLGHAWGCHGRKDGGRAICSGLGDLDKAACLAGQDGEAFVNYGFEGVCHQMANRILLPAGLLVVDAKRYELSSAFYGAYGRDLETFAFYSPLQNPWPQFSECYGV
jgi:hypothetical protein